VSHALLLSFNCIKRYTSFGIASFIKSLFILISHDVQLFLQIDLYIYIYECSFTGLLDIQNILLADTGISGQTKGHSFGDHLGSESVNVMPSSVIEAPIMLCSVCL
jgi:hypothetical protein